MSWGGCTVCGRVGEHADWCAWVSDALEERTVVGSPVCVEWPAFLLEAYSDAVRVALEADVEPQRLVGAL